MMNSLNKFSLIMSIMLVVLFSCNQSSSSGSKKDFEAELRAFLDSFIMASEERPYTFNEGGITLRSTYKARFGDVSFSWKVRDQEEGEPSFEIQEEEGQILLKLSQNFLASLTEDLVKVPLEVTVSFNGKNLSGNLDYLLDPDKSDDERKKDAEKIASLEESLQLAENRLTELESNPLPPSSVPPESSTNGESSERIANLEREREGQESTLAQVRDRAESLSNLVEEQRRQIEELTQRVGEPNSEQTREIENLQRESAERQNEVEDLRNQLAQAALAPNDEQTQEIQDLQERLAEETDRVSQLQQDLANAAAGLNPQQTQEIEGLEQRIEERNQEIQRLQNDLNNAPNLQEVADLQQRINDRNQEVQRLQNDLNNAPNPQEVNDLRQQVAQLQGQLAANGAPLPSPPPPGGNNGALPPPPPGGNNGALPPPPPGGLNGIPGAPPPVGQVGQVAANAPQGATPRLIRERAQAYIGTLDPNALPNRENFFNGLEESLRDAGNTAGDPFADDADFRDFYSKPFTRRNPVNKGGFAVKWDRLLPEGYGMYFLDFAHDKLDFGNNANLPAFDSRFEKTLKAGVDAFKHEAAGNAFASEDAFYAYAENVLLGLLEGANDQAKRDNFINFIFNNRNKIKRVFKETYRPAWNKKVRGEFDFNEPNRGRNFQGFINYMAQRSARAGDVFSLSSTYKASLLRAIQEILPPATGGAQANLATNPPSSILNRKRWYVDRINRDYAGDLNRVYQAIKERAIPRDGTEAGLQAYLLTLTEVETGRGVNLQSRDPFDRVMTAYNPAASSRLGGDTYPPVDPTMDMSFINFVSYVTENPDPYGLIAAAQAQAQAQAQQPGVVGGAQEKMDAIVAAASSYVVVGGDYSLAIGTRGDGFYEDLAQRVTNRVNIGDGIDDEPWDDYKELFTNELYRTDLENRIRSEDVFDTNSFELRLLYNALESAHGDGWDISDDDDD